MTIAPNQIVLSITIYIANQYRTRQTLGPAWVKFPWSSVGISFGSFVPTRTDYNITSSIIIQIPKTDPMATLRSNRMTFELSLFFLIPNDRGCLLVPLVGDPFAFAVTIDIKKLAEFIGLLLGIDPKGSAPTTGPT